jgi:hypothetical protein
MQSKVHAPTGVSSKAGIAKRVETRRGDPAEPNHLIGEDGERANFRSISHVRFFLFWGGFFSTPWHVLALTSTAQHEELFTLAVKLHTGEFSVALFGCQQGIYELIRVLRQKLIHVDTTKVLNERRVGGPSWPHHGRGGR